MTENIDNVIKEIKANFDALDNGFDMQLSKKLKSGRYNLSKIIRETGISRYWLNDIKRGVYVKPYIIVALNDYFKNLGE